MKQINYYKMLPAEEVNNTIAMLPKATKVSLFNQAGENFVPVPKWQAIRVNTAQGGTHYVGVVTPTYQLVQHSEAFRPIIEGLTLSGVHDFKATITATPQRAQMNIFTEGKGFDTVSIGFTVENSLDGHSRLRYGIEFSQVHKYIEIVGYRQVCANGMKIQVPIDEADFVRPEVQREIQVLLADHKAITHTKSIEDKMRKMQYLVEAVALLKDPVESLIKAGKKVKIKNKELLKGLVDLHIGNRYKSRVLKQYEREAKDLWGLFNAITYVASHDKTLVESSRDTLLEKAAIMLRVEVQK